MGDPVYPRVPAAQPPDPISELALDLRWAWNHASDELWRELEPELWEATQNAWLVLQSVSQDTLRRLHSDSRYRERVRELLDKKHELEAAEVWFQKTHPKAPLNAIAYFSMEYMLSEALPIYSGGLGNVAGDQLKAASDLGVPVIGIGLLYQQGYFRQEIDSNGAQIARYPFNDPDQLPIRPLRNASGEWLRLKLLLPGCTLWIRAWEAKAGCRRLYLMDTNDPANPPAMRTITGELYGGGPEMRLRQEAVLGLGGWQLVRALGLQPEVCHLNEGHAAFAVLERARWFMEEHGQPFDVALTATRAGNLFTTHTPVEAGFDRFAPDLMERYFKWYAEQLLKISMRDLMALGRRNGDDNSEPFNMAYLAMRGSGAANGVSRLHGAVSRRLFAGLFPRWPEAETPVGYVTNGVHVPTWDSAEADRLWTGACGKDRWRGPLEYVEDQVRFVQDRDLWRLRCVGREALIEFARKRLAADRAYHGAAQPEIDEAGRAFDDTRLTLGFARRFASYKRPTMLLHDPERLIRILTDPDRPVQLLIAGKAHPQDGAGQDMIRQWNEFMRRSEVHGRAAFLSDYDMRLTQILVEGVDVWLNTPRRPWEASGTSGMKVLANGGLNLSELDGWWSEAYAPDVGWAIGDGKDRGDDPAWDAAEATALYELLERDVIPSFYDRDGEGIPRGWVARIRESMARLTGAFSANRSLRQYTEEYYLPLASAYVRRAADGGRAAVEFVEWKRSIASHWHEVRFGDVAIAQRHGAYEYKVVVHLGGVSPEDVQVQLYADPRGLEQPFRRAMTVDAANSPSPAVYRYSGVAPADRPADDYTPRVVPCFRDALVPLELPLIAWQK
jgi:glycogen phosphorylase